MDEIETMRVTFCAIALLGLLFSSLVALPAAAIELSGTWIRQAPAVMMQEGLVLDSDGRLGLLGIHSMTGLRWAVEGETLVLTTNTERYPEPQPSRLTIKEISADTLTLTGETYLAGTWRRDDAAAGRVDGSVVYRERMMLPPDATLRVEVRDVSRADAPSMLIGGATIPIDGRGPPYAFRSKFSGMTGWGCRFTPSGWNEGGSSGRRRPTARCRSHRRSSPICSKA
jgi:hypothetical protein